MDCVIDFDHFAPGSGSLFKHHLPLWHAKNIGKKFHQSDIRCAFYRGGGKSDFQRVALQTNCFGTFRARLYIQGQGKPLLLGIKTPPDIRPSLLH